MAFTSDVHVTIRMNFSDPLTFQLEPSLDQTFLSPILESLTEYLKDYCHPFSVVMLLASSIDILSLLTC